MQHEKKNFVYLQRQIHNRAGIASAMLSVTGFIFAPTAAYIHKAYQPLERSIMGFSSARNGFDKGKWHAFFRATKSKLLRFMTHSRKTAWRDTQSITFKADWLDFTEHLSNAQVGRLLRCVARFERGDINPQHVAELRKDAAVGVAYNFITEQLERRHA